MSLVSLRPVRRADAGELIQANRESSAYHRPWMRPFTSLDGFEDWFAAHLIGASAGFVVRDLASERVTGVTSLSQIFLKGFQNAYLTYYGMAPFAGRGFITEAVRLTCVHAFIEIGLHRIEANIQPTNLKSVAVVKRVGFRKEGFSPRYLNIGGEWCDHERWALLADELQS